MRKLTLTPAKIALLEKHARLGVPRADMFVASGVSSTTFYRWMRIGEALAEGDSEHPDIPKPPKRRSNESLRKYNRRLRRYNEEQELYVTLYERMPKADAYARIDMVRVIRSAAEGGDWRAAVAFLERRDPLHWNLKLILRKLAIRDTQNEPSIMTPDMHEHSLMAPDMLELMRLLKQDERTLSKELEARAQNGKNSQAKAK